MAILPFCVEIEVENQDKNIKHDVTFVFSKPIYSLYKYVGTYYQLNFDFFFHHALSIIFNFKFKLKR